MLKIFNYSKLLGAFIDAAQVVTLSEATKDRQEKKMLEEANRLIAAGWARKEFYLSTRENVDMAAERLEFFPKVVDGMVQMPLQYVQDYMTKKMVAVQNNCSIHNTKEATELRELFAEYGVQTTAKFTGVEFGSLAWSAKQGQKPKVLVHASVNDEPICIRLEAASELSQKFLHAVLALDLQPGELFNLEVEAVDPAIERNAKAGKQVVVPGTYVNHNLTVVVDGEVHHGRPPAGTKYAKMSLEAVEMLYRQAMLQSTHTAVSSGSAKRANTSGTALQAASA